MFAILIEIAIAAMLMLLCHARIEMQIIYVNLLPIISLGTFNFFSSKIYLLNDLLINMLPVLSCPVLSCPSGLHVYIHIIN